MVLGLDRDLHFVADCAGAAPARRHRTSVGVGERDVLIGALKHAAHVREQAAEVGVDPRGGRAVPTRASCIAANRIDAIASSARPISELGTLMPRALAVFRLMSSRTYPTE
jgi:hypothetical protein